MLTYNLLRLGLLAACLGLGWLAGLHSVLLIVVALLASGALSWFWLRPQREAMGQAIEQSVERGRLKLAERTASEDAVLDAAAAAPQPPSRKLAAPHGDQPAS